MGLFSKIKSATTGVCSICGKEVAHVGKDEFVCSDCQKRMKVTGFINYTDLVAGKKPTPDVVRQYAEHRDGILEKYRKPQMTSGVQDRTHEAQERTIRYGYGFVSTGNFAASYGEYEGIVVDFDDVIAVAYEEVFNKKLQTKGSSTFSFVMLTKDKFVPYLGQAVYIKQKGIFSKVDKENLDEQIEKFRSSCSHLEYPISTIKELKKALKSDGKLTTKLDLALDDAGSCSGAFDYAFQVGEDSGANAGMPSAKIFDWLRTYGYYDIEELMKSML